MKVEDALSGVTSIFVDSAAVIYLIEDHPVYAQTIQRVFQRLDDGLLKGITSPITLAECLVVPQRRRDEASIARFTDLIVTGEGVQFVRIDEIIAKKGASLRADHALRLPDALQLATAIVAGCDAFLTNDIRLKRIGEIRVIVIDELIL